MQKFFVKFAGLGLAMSLGLSAHAGYEFSNVDSNDMENIIKELGNNFTYTPVSGASSLGSIFGFKVGAILGMTQAPEISDLAGSDAGIPHAALLGRLSIPFGLTFGINMIPETKLGDASVALTGFEVQWTITDGLLILPLDLAVRGTYTTSKFTFSQDVTTPSAATVDVTTDITTTSLALIAGVDLLVVKPYVGVGTVTADGTMDLEGNSSVFGGDLTGDTKASAKPSGTQVLMGVDFSLIFMDIGVEYAQQFGASRYTGKLAFGF